MNKIFACSQVPYQKKNIFLFSMNTPLLRGIAKIHIQKSLITEILIKDFCFVGTSVVKDHVYVEIVPIYPEAVVRKCSIKKAFIKIRKIHRKAPVPSSLF